MTRLNKKPRLFSSIDELILICFADVFNRRAALINISLHEMMNENLNCWLINWVKNGFKTKPDCRFGDYLRAEQIYPAYIIPVKLRLIFILALCFLLKNNLESIDADFLKSLLFTILNITII